MQLFKMDDLVPCAWCRTETRWEYSDGTHRARACRMLCFERIVRNKTSPATLAANGAGNHGA
jgi:hypothetical protein